MFNQKVTVAKPMIISCLLYILFSIITFILTKRFIHLMILWNLFLAALPLLFARLFVIYSEQRVWHKCLFCSFLWLLFFPNAPYLLTDVIHLQGISFYSISEDHAVIYSSNLLDWMSLVHLGVGIFIGTWSGMLSLMILHQWMIRRLHRFLVNTLLFIVYIVSGFAIYLGRFLRLNSWDLFQPFAFFEKISKSISVFSVGFSLLFALYICLIYSFCSFIFLSGTGSKQKFGRW
ncbi:DUF1361 domain-containing protein [Sporolactobacillus kofuensis]|uniref:DUF1361 domain-containing protein n=1 Tax=Sporolactobacillus kofuensis TaxID=269672 RepID=A0ABW1WFF2_9BACL|nr:DUF1361 domain-containing protein [Sporolactobacillus kofuensis]MCO7176221.1 DUF1361 domain-containing protein [Sporolactobacillus kofuensis]